MIKEVCEDLKQLDDILLDCEQRLETADYTEVLELFQDEIAQQQSNLFANEDDANLVTWAQSKPSTIARDNHDRIIVESGRLKASRTVDGPGNVNEVSPRGLLFGTRVDDSIFHQLGTSRMPASPPVGLPVQLVDQLANAIADAAVKKLKVTV